MTTNNLTIRLDKWLWAARFYKTRTIAKEAIAGGKVSVNGQKAKPSKIPRVGDTVNIRQGWNIKTIIIDEIAEQRRTADFASTLYHETEESIEKRKTETEMRKSNLGQIAPDKRPDKKNRRALNKFKQSY